MGCPPFAVHCAFNVSKHLSFHIIEISKVTFDFAVLAFRFTIPVLVSSPRTGALAVVFRIGLKYRRRLDIKGVLATILPKLTERKRKTNVIYALARSLVPFTVLVRRSTSDAKHCRAILRKRHFCNPRTHACFPCDSVHASAAVELCPEEGFTKQKSFRRRPPS